MSIVRDRLVAIIADAVGSRGDEVKDDSRLREDLGADSIDLIEVIVMAEDGFDCSISDDEAEAVATLADAIALVERKRPDLAVPA